ncbi:MAG: molybdenum ABC transporter ATP-binding protein [Deltaproteobacteria bacterium]|nr:molybdenum ABC transporter ATP-binding protein [Deltaproteobacteria bacterium]
MTRIVLKCRLPLANFFLDVDAAFEARVAAIFGPSGAGKTSLLDAIAGLRAISSGEIAIGERLLFSSSRRLALPPQRRSIGYVPQEAALFPHLSVRKNVLFGARPAADSAAADGINLAHVAELLEIESLLNRSASQLSGGEAQRVALARAILSRPELLLLDEPLASLDIGLKQRIIPYLRRVRDEFSIPMIYVTHNVTEVFSLADWVVMIKEGKVIDQGSPRDILPSQWISADPDQSQVENILNGRWICADPGAGRSTVRLESGKELLVPFFEAPANSFVQIRIRGDDILLATEKPSGISASNVFRGMVRKIELVDGQAIIRIDSGDMLTIRLTAGAVDSLGLVENRDVYLIIKTRSCVVL